MSHQDYYEILGVTKSATDEDIKKSYRRLASKYHPDKFPGDNSPERDRAEETFKKINEAYDTLGNPEKRVLYNNGGASGNPFFTQHTAGASAAEFRDIFDDLLKSGTFTGFKFEQDPSTHRARPNTQIVLISLEDAFLGKSIRVLPGTTIKVPAGVRSGTKFYGDGKFFQVDIQPHFKFKRANDDLLIDVQINAIEAILGVDTVLDHLDGSQFEFKIPAGIQPGQIVKLTSKGMKNPETDRMGDMLVRLSITIPRSLSDADKAILKNLVHRESIKI
jgi:DnaJ-class molecular chaperone